MSKINKIVKSNKINLKEQPRQLLPGLLEMVAEQFIGFTIEKKISVKQIDPNPWSRFKKGRVSIIEDTSVRYILDTEIGCSDTDNCSRE